MTIFTTIEAQKAETLAFLRGWSTARLTYRPSADGWSAIQVLDHIVKVESRIFAAARRGLDNPHRIGVRDRLGFLLVERVFRSERRVKVPSSASEVLPDTDVTLAAVTQRWDYSRCELSELVTRMTPQQMNGGGVFRHPVSGWMSFSQVLIFFSAHIQHHDFQLARLAAESKGL